MLQRCESIHKRRQCRFCWFLHTFPPTACDTPRLLLSSLAANFPLAGGGKEKNGGCTRQGLRYQPFLDVSQLICSGELANVVVQLDHAFAQTSPGREQMIISMLDPLRWLFISSGKNLQRHIAHRNTLSVPTASRANLITPRTMRELDR